MMSAACISCKEDGDQKSNLLLLFHVKNIITSALNNDLCLQVASDLRELYEIRIKSTVDWFLVVHVKCI